MPRYPCSSSGLPTSRATPSRVDWRPDLDDAAMLRATMLFAAEPALTLRLAAEPTLHAFCGPDSAVPDLSIPAAWFPLPANSRPPRRLS